MINCVHTAASLTYQRRPSRKPRVVPLPRASKFPVKERLLGMIYFSENSAGKWHTMDEESDGFSCLFAKLCELSFNNEANKGWDIYRRPRLTGRRKKALKLCLYDTLFEELRAPWVDKLSRTRFSNKADHSSFHVVDKLSIAAYELRIARRFDDADKLERFVCQWRNLKGW